MTAIDPTALLAVADAAERLVIYAKVKPATVRALVAAYVEHEGCADALAADRERLAAAVEAADWSGIVPGTQREHAARIIRNGGTP